VTSTSVGSSSGGLLTGVLRCSIVELSHVHRLASPSIVAKWLPGVLYGVLLFALLSRWSHYLILPGSLVVSLGLFYAGLAIMDISVGAVKAAGFLISGVPDGGLWPVFTPADLQGIDWAVVVRLLPDIMTVVLIAVMGMLLNMSSIEMASGVELDMNHEFAAGGVGNALAGLSGCFPGYPSISLSVLAYKTGAYSRLTGLFAALLSGYVLFAGGSLLEYFPKPLLGGLLFLLGLFFIQDWLITAFHRLPRVDYGIVLSIFLVVVLFGFMHGVAFGLVATVVFFVVRFSRVPVVQQRFTGAQRRCVRRRSAPHFNLLATWGRRIVGYELSGYLFFGSAATLIETLKAELEPEIRPDFVLLDFERVSGFDISAVNHLHRFALASAGAGTSMVIASAPPLLVEIL
jgi:SulP family sulfate permease